MTHISVIFEKREFFLVPVSKKCQTCSGGPNCVDRELGRANISHKVGMAFGDSEKVIPVVAYSIQDAEAIVELVAMKFVEN